MSIIKSFSPLLQYNGCSNKYFTNGWHTEQGGHQPVVTRAGHRRVVTRLILHFHERRKVEQEDYPVPSSGGMALI